MTLLATLTLTLYVLIRERSLARRIVMLENAVMALAVKAGMAGSDTIR